MERLKELEVYSGIAIFFVVLIHLNVSFYGYKNLVEVADMRIMYNYLPQTGMMNKNQMLNLLDRIIHISVPMFIFVSGFKYAYNYHEEDYRHYTVKKLKKVFKPFIILSTAYLIYVYGRTIITEYGQISLAEELISFIKSFLFSLAGRNKIMPFWYIPMYLCVVLAYPIITKFIAKKEIRLILFVMLSLAWVVNEALNPDKGRFQIPFIFVYYLLLFEIGVQFFRMKFYQRRGNLIILAYIVILLAGGFITNKATYVIVYEAFLIPIAAIAFYYISVKLKDVRPLQLLGHYSFYVFLFHEPFIREFTAQVIIRLGIFGYYPIVILSAVVVCYMSIIFYLMIKKLKISQILF